MRGIHVVCLAAVCACVLVAGAPLQLDDGLGLPAASRPAPAKPDVAGLANRGELVFTGTCTETQALMSTMSMPPTIMMRLTFGNVEMLKGAKPAATVFGYSVVEGRDLSPAAGLKYLAVASATDREVRISSLFEATDANLALAKKAVTLPVGWSVDAKGAVVSPWAALGDKAWPKDVKDSALQADLRCAKTGRPALRAGAGVSLAVEQVPPEKPQQYRNPFGDGKFKLTVKNTTDKPVVVPALVMGGTEVLWADSLFVMTSGTAHLLPGAGKVPADARPCRLEPNASVTAVIDTLPLSGVSWPRGGSRIYFQFCLGELSTTNFFYYFSNFHDPMRAKAVGANG